jgi:hypothetical protein
VSGTRRSGRRSVASLRPAGEFARRSYGEAKPTPNELRDTLRKLIENAERLPSDLYHKLRRLLEWHLNQVPWTMEEVHLRRWYFVRYAMREKGKRIVDDSAFEYAAEAVADTPAKGGPAAMKQSYIWVQKHPDRIGHGGLGFFERHYA